MQALPLREASCPAPQGLRFSPIVRLKGSVRWATSEAAHSRDPGESPQSPPPSTSVWARVCIYGALICIQQPKEEADPHFTAGKTEAQKPQIHMAHSETVMELLFNPLFITTAVTKMKANADRALTVPSTRFALSCYQHLGGGWVNCFTEKARLGV